MTPTTRLLFWPGPLLIAIPLLAVGTAVADTNATPKDASGTPASNSSYWSDVQGGLLGGLTGAPEHCTSKTCNLYYGDNPPEDPPVDAAAPTLAGPQSNPVESYEAPGRRGVVADGERSACEPSPKDPWRCYRR